MDAQVACIVNVPDPQGAHRRIWRLVAGRDASGPILYELPGVLHIVPSERQARATLRQVAAQLGVRIIRSA
jgi:hypothetical protein